MKSINPNHHCMALLCCVAFTLFAEDYPSISRKSCKGNGIKLFPHVTHYLFLQLLHSSVRLWVTLNQYCFSKTLEMVFVHMHSTEFVHVMQVIFTFFYILLLQFTV